MLLLSKHSYVKPIQYTSNKMRIDCLFLVRAENNGDVKSVATHSKQSYFSYMEGDE